MPHTLHVDLVPLDRVCSKGGRPSHHACLGEGVSLCREDKNRKGQGPGIQESTPVPLSVWPKIC